MKNRSHILSDIFIDGRYCAEAMNSIMSWLEFQLDRHCNGYVNEPENLYKIIQTISGKEYLKTPWFNDLNDHQLSRYISIILLSNMVSYKSEIMDEDASQLAKAILGHKEFGVKSLDSILNAVNVSLSMCHPIGSDLNPFKAVTKRQYNENTLAEIILEVSKRNRPGLFGVFESKIRSIFDSHIKKDSFAESEFVNTLTRLMTCWLIPQCNNNKDAVMNEVIYAISSSDMFKNADSKTFQALHKCLSQINNAFQDIHINAAQRKTASTLNQHIYNAAILSIKNDFNKEAFDITTTIKFCAKSLPEEKFNQLINELLDLCEFTHEDNSWKVILNIVSSLNHIDRYFRTEIFERSMLIINRKLDALDEYAGKMKLLNNIKGIIERCLDKDIFLSKDFLSSFDPDFIKPELTSLLIRKVKGLSDADYLNAIEKATSILNANQERSNSIEYYTLIQELTGALASKHLIPSLHGDNFNNDILQCVVRNGFDLTVINESDAPLFDGKNFSKILEIDEVESKELLSQNEKFIELAIKNDLQNRLAAMTSSCEQVKIKYRHL